jgi:hypothetical protein
MLLQLQAKALPQQQYYPIDWPYEMPFHKGEVAFSIKRTWYPRIGNVVRTQGHSTYMPRSTPRLLWNLPFIVASATATTKCEAISRSKGDWQQ